MALYESAHPSRMEKSLFVVTILGVLATDLLIGAGMGTA
jgi:hypothetical protein